MTDAADRLTTITAPGNVLTGYTFDNNGKQTAAGSSTFSYDLADRLTAATVGSTTVAVIWTAAWSIGGQLIVVWLLIRAAFNGQWAAVLILATEILVAAGVAVWVLRRSSTRGLRSA